MKKIFFLAVVIVLLLTPGIAFAVASDTRTGTGITAEGTLNMMTYTDLKGATKPPVSSETLTTWVTSEYGLAAFPDRSDQFISPPETAYYYYSLTSEGNNDDTYTVTCEISFGVISGDFWYVTVEGGTDGVTYGTVLANLDKTTKKYQVAKLMTEDQIYYYRITVKPYDNLTYSPDGAFALVTLEAKTASSPTGYYTGANGNSYGGLASSSDATVTQISTAKMTMSRVATVDAPVAFKGGTHEAVPGAIITYTIMTSNEGSVKAQNVIIVDKVPFSTSGECVGCGSGAQAGVVYVGITAAKPTARGWSAYTTITDDPVKTYGAGGWDLVTTEASDPYTIGSDVKWIKFEKQTVEASEDRKTLTWGVVIM